MMKLKLFVLAMAVSGLLTLAGCQPKESDTPTEPVANETPMGDTTAVPDMPVETPAPIPTEAAPVMPPADATVPTPDTTVPTDAMPTPTPAV